MHNNFDDSLIYDLNEEIQEITETLTVTDNKVSLTQIPDSFSKVKITGYKETIKTAPNSGFFNVNYKNGIVNFHDDVTNGTSVSVTYYGKGRKLLGYEAVKKSDFDKNAKKTPWVSVDDSLVVSGNWSPAVQAAIDTGAAKIQLPSGDLRFDDPINITNKSSGSVVIKGVGMLSGGTKIQANTGGVLFDTTGSQWVGFENLYVYPGQANPSTIGILFARSVSHPYAQFNWVNNVTINLGSDPSANNGNGRVGIYNYAAELWRANNIYIVADVPVVFSNSNIYEIISPFTTIHTDFWSCSQFTITGASTLNAKTGCAIDLSGVVGVEFPNLYILGDATNTTKYAIHLSRNCYRVSYSGHTEGFHQIAKVNNTKVYDLTLHCTCHLDGTTPLIEIEATNSNTTNGIENANISIRPVGNGDDLPSVVINKTGSYQDGVRYSRITLHKNQSVNMVGGYDVGNTFYCSDASPTITQSSSPGFFSSLIQAKGFTKVLGDFYVSVGDLLLKNKRITNGTAAPTTGTWGVGDYCMNTAPSEQGTTGSKYIIRGWSCITAGTPGTWVEDRGLTGN